MGLQTENGNVFTHSYAISKQKKLEFPDWSQMNDLFKSLLTVKDFNYYFFFKFSMTICHLKVRLFY